MNLQKSDRVLQRWTTHSKEYNTKVSVVMNELMTLQSEASMRALGHEPKPDDSKRAKIFKALQALTKTSTTKVVEVTLPEFTVEGVHVGAMQVRLPLKVRPANAMVPLDAEAFRWLFQRCQAKQKPEPRKAVKPPLPCVAESRGTAYWHKSHGKYVSKARPEDLKNGEPKWESHHLSDENSIGSTSAGAHDEPTSEDIAFANALFEDDELQEHTASEGSETEEWWGTHHGDVLDSDQTLPEGTQQVERALLDRDKIFETFEEACGR